jgi:hypothetical protein
MQNWLQILASLHRFLRLFLTRTSRRVTPAALD